MVTGPDGSPKTGTYGRDYSVSVNYRVRKGDTLTTISKATGIPISVLAKDNALKDPNVLATGQVISLRYHPGPEEAFHHDENGDTPTTFYDQERDFEMIDAGREAHYQRVAKEGAQEVVKHMDTKG